MHEKKASMVPSVIVMESAGDLEVEFSNDDEVTHAVQMPGGAGDYAGAVLPAHQGVRLRRVHLSNPGLYLFSCPVSNHAGRGMLGVILVKGEIPPEARLDRPKQPRP